VIRSAWLRLLVLDGAWFSVVFGRRCSEVAPKFVSRSALTRIGVPVARTRHDDGSVAVADVLIRFDPSTAARHHADKCAITSCGIGCSLNEELARRTGRFPQLVDSRSGVNGLLLTVSPGFRAASVESADVWRLKQSAAR
jgi:hypothetical protein